jgi:hypothetical protein
MTFSAGGKNGGGWPVMGCRQGLGRHAAPTPVLMATALVVLTVLGTVPGGGPATAQEAADASQAAPAGNGGPEILRGSVAPPPPRVEPAAGPDERLVAAGERIWFVDPSSRRLTGCRLINTIEVDGQAIRCTERRLPRGAARRN